MKIALVLAPSFPKPYPLLGLACLDASLKQAGHEVRIFDFAASLEFEHSGGEGVWHDPEFVAAYQRAHPDFFDGMCAALAAYAPDLAGFSVWQCNAPASRIVCEGLKKRLPEVFTVFGGPEAGFRPENFIKDVFLDALVRGEGEHALLQLAAGQTKTPPYGVLLKSGGALLDGGPAAQVADLDTLPFPDFSGFPLERYSTKLLPLAFNRGCVHRCAFCNVAATWRGCRHRSPESLYQEMLSDNELYGTEIFQVCSPAVNADPRRLERLCGLLIDGGKKFIWNGSAFFSDALTPELCGKMGRSGIQVLDFGLESAAPNVLKLMGKAFSPDTARRNIRDCHDAGIRVFLNIIVGFPGETPEDLELTKAFLLQNRQWIDRIGPPSECVAARGSLLDENPQRYGLDPHPAKRLSNWELLDGSSTHARRLEQVEKFRRWAADNGLLFPC